MTRLRLPPLRHASPDARFRAAVRRRLREEGPTALDARRLKPLVLGGALFAVSTLVLSGALTAPWLALAVAIAQPLYLVTAMGVAHDASHGALGPRWRWLDRIGTFVFDLVGVNGYVWHFDHVTAHHDAPNVPRYDANLYGWGPIRLDPWSPRRSHHRYQALYAPFIYALASLFKVYLGDFIAFARHRVEAYMPRRHARRAWLRLVAFKAWAVTVALVLPLALNDHVGAVLGGYVAGHVFSGLLMGAVFQPTHTNEEVAWIRPADDGRLPVSFERHVLDTAADLSVANPFVTWIAGGLNLHAVHHLFPRVPHLELPAVARAVIAEAPAHGLRYRVLGGWVAALRSHLRALAVLGAADPVGDAVARVTVADLRERSSTRAVAIHAASDGAA